MAFLTIKEKIAMTEQQIREVQDESARITQRNQARITQRNQELNMQYNVLVGRINALKEIEAEGQAATFPAAAAAEENKSDESATSEPIKTEDALNAAVEASEAINE